MPGGSFKCCCNIHINKSMIGKMAKNGLLMEFHEKNTVMSTSL